jgi:hypothetical protein
VRFAEALRERIRTRAIGDAHEWHLLNFLGVAIFLDVCAGKRTCGD